jgi:hypothetical protein
VIVQVVAVVAREDDDCPVGEAEAIECVEDAADLRVHEGDGRPVRLDGLPAEVVGHLVLLGPGAVRTGSAGDQTVSFNDVLWTKADVVGKDLPSGAGPDSFSFLPALKGGTFQRAPVVMQSGSSGFMTIRWGWWKLIDELGSGGSTLRPYRRPGRDDESVRGGTRYRRTPSRRNAPNRPGGAEPLRDADRAFLRTGLITCVRRPIPAARAGKEHASAAVHAAAPARAVLPLSPRSVVSVLYQHRSEQGTLGASVRWRWECAPGSELFVVYTEGRDTTVPVDAVRNRSLVVRITRLFRF